MEESPEVILTKMTNSDSTVLCLVYDFFKSQFLLRNEELPLESQEFINNEIVQDNNYKKTIDVLVTQGKLYIEDYRDRITPQIQTFLPGLETPDNGQNNFNSLSRHFFHEGIDWNLILTYFVFGAELAYHANLQRLATVHDVAQWLAEYTTQHLLPWITDNGGWVSLFLFLFYLYAWFVKEFICKFYRKSMTTF